MTVESVSDDLVNYLAGKGEPVSQLLEDVDFTDGGIGSGVPSPPGTVVPIVVLTRAFRKRPMARYRPGKNVFEFLQRLGFLDLA
jgi:hypothetical protein